MHTEQIIGTALLVLLGVIVLYVLVNITKFYLMFHARKCKHCGHTMTFKRVHEENGEESFDFHCKHCQSWERVPKKEFYGDKD